MVLFAVALVVVLLEVGVYALYNPGTLSITMAGNHFVAVPAWALLALGAAAPLSLFVVYVLWTGLRIQLLKRAARRASGWDDPKRWPAVERPAAQWPLEPPPMRARLSSPTEARPPGPAEAWPGGAEEARPAGAAAAAGGRRRRASQAPARPAGPQPAPKRSWLTPRD